MRVERLAVFTVAVILVLSIGSAFGQVVDGVQVGPAGGTPAVQGHVESEPGSIDFDDSPAPCNFVSTVALTDEYSALGVIFGGPDGLDGGAILDECGNFGVTGYSPPNFLAFNVNSTLSDGGTPRGPEQISFSEIVDTVSLNAGHASSGTITLECYDSGGVSVGSQSIAGTASLQPISVTATGQISYCWLSFTGTVAVFDNLTYNPPIPVELQSLAVE